MEEAFITNTILQNLIAFLAPVVAVGLVIFCVVQAMQIAKGGQSGSVLKLITGAFIFIILLGIMFAAGSFHTYGNAFRGVIDQGVERGAEDLENILR